VGADAFVSFAVVDLGGGEVTIDSACVPDWPN